MNDMQINVITYQKTLLTIEFIYVVAFERDWYDREVLLSEKNNEERVGDL